MFRVRKVILEEADKKFNPQFRSRGIAKFQIRTRCVVNGDEEQQSEQRVHHDIVINTLLQFRTIPFMGQIGCAVHKGKVFLYGEVEAWNNDAFRRINQTMEEMEDLLTYFSRKHPAFCEMVAVSSRPNVVLVN